ncbi:BamA/TamA family outer membrane protein [Salisaeta longa]|uniref:BamA/TamA family outer membrane protein n=1 Tax=Salisaeta longa TaxID=503170 RepID=UPI00146C2B75|nr:BamA/TamA family outer membrane protein [Salisaeta longa]
MLLLCSMGVVRGQAAPPDPYLNLRVYPLATWGPQAGWGGGAGLVAHHVGHPGTVALLTAAPAQYETVLTASIATRNPHAAPWYVALTSRYMTTTRQPFFGLGPFARGPQRTLTDLQSVRATVRLGYTLLDGRVLVEPHVGWRAHALEAPPVAPADVQSHLTQAAAADPYGVVAGGSVAYDTRDRRAAPTRGLLLQGTAERFGTLGTDELTFDQFQIEAAGYVPLGGRHRLFGVVAAGITRARSGGPVPFYLRMRLDGRRMPGWRRDRFFGNDRLLATVGYRFPVGTVAQLFRIEGHAAAQVGSVYNNVFEDFDPAVTFAEEPPVTPAAVPLRPAASLGVHLAPLFRDESYIDLAVGVSPEGVTGVRFTLTRTLRSLRPPHHE